MLNHKQVQRKIAAILRKQRRMSKQNSAGGMKVKALLRRIK